MKTCPTCRTTSPLAAFAWSGTDEVQLAAQRSWYPQDLSICLTCHELSNEAKMAANVVHDTWLDTWGARRGPPPSNDEIKADLLEYINPYFKNDQEPWMDDYKRLAVAFAITNDDPEVVAITALLAVAVAEDNLKAIAYFKELQFLTTALTNPDR